MGSSPTSATIWPVGQEVKTPPFHGGNMGSIPVRVTKTNKSELFRKSKLVRIQVHQDNNIAIGIYEKYGFVEVKRAEWNHDFLVMELVL